MDKNSRKPGGNCIFLQNETAHAEADGKNLA